MGDLQDLLKSFREFTEFLRNDADVILLANIKNLRTRILERIESGKDPKGNPYSKYSETKVSASLFKGITKPAGAKSFIDRSIKDKKSISYKDVRDSVFKSSKNTKNFFFTGDMLNSIDEQVDKKSNGEYEISIAPEGRDNINKLISNENREEAEILGFTQEDIDFLVEDIEEALTDVLNDLIK